ncbi:hypothetical protein [Novosphingopyxis sp.]|uniref:hypothetical protein n=1 Tax=Novosphingopyxis sp. TaxID=2709690 RepID=UPI003B5BE036
MTRADTLRALRAAGQVKDVKARLADQTLQNAKDSLDEAGKSLSEKRAAFGDAERAWSEGVMRPGFDPAMTGWLASTLVGAETEMIAAQALHRQRRDIAERSLNEKARAEGERRVVRDMSKGSLRLLQKHREEIALADMADRHAAKGKKR